MFRPEETGGLGLTDTTGVFLPQANYAEAESNANEFIQIAMVAAPYSFPTVRLIVPRAVSRVVFRAVPGVSFPNTALRLAIFNPMSIQ